MVYHLATGGGCQALGGSRCQAFFPVGALDGGRYETAHRPVHETVPRGTDKRKLADATLHSDPTLTKCWR